MTLDVHHPSPTNVDPLGEGFSAGRDTQRADERDKSQRLHDDVFHSVATSNKAHPVIFYWRGAEALMQINQRRPQQLGGISDCPVQVTGGQSVTRQARPLYRRRRTIGVNL